MSRPIVRTAFLVVAAIFLGCVIVQLFLAGLGVFDSPTSFLTHRDFGYAFGWLVLVLLVLGIVGRVGQVHIALVVAIAVAFGLQSFFVAMRTDRPDVAALHPLNGALILVLSVELVRRAWRSRPRSTEGAVPDGPPGLPR